MSSSSCDGARSGCRTSPYRRFVDVVEDLPKTAVGRVEKFKLRQRGVQPTTWDREAAGYRLARPPRVYATLR